MFKMAEEQNFKTNQKPITEETAEKLIGLLAKVKEIPTKPVQTIKNSQILAGIVGTVGLVMFALGIEKLITSVPELESFWVDIILGLVLLSVSGLLLRKLS